jgi:hypothetical protein
VEHLYRLFEFAATALQQSHCDDISATTIDTDTVTAIDYESITFPCIDFASLKKLPLDSRNSAVTSKQLFITVSYFSLQASIKKLLLSDKKLIIIFSLYL